MYEQECFQVGDVPPALYRGGIPDRDPPSGQRVPPDRDPLPHEQRPHPPFWTKSPPDVDPTWTETPSPMDTDPTLDRDTPPRGQTNTCENITFANFVCGR